VTEALQIVRETKAMRETLLPAFDGMYADALAADVGKDTGDHSLIARLWVVIPLLVRPDAAQFRKKYGKLLLTVVHLSSRIANDFLARPRPGQKDLPHNRPLP
jgi:hypothetical protein